MMDIYMEPPRRLLSTDYIEALAERVVALNLSRIKSTDWLAAKIYGLEGTIFDWNGEPLCIEKDIVEDAYGDDAACTWNSELKRFAIRRPVRRPRGSLILRLGLWDAAMKINGTPVLS
jgi:hypothetical protein